MQVCDNIHTHGWKEVQTDDGTYTVHGRQWASYLRPEEVHKIGATISQAGLRGAALWALDLDDWRGRCACSSNPLLTALRQGVLDPPIPKFTHFV